MRDAPIGGEALAKIVEMQYSQMVVCGNYEAQTTLAWNNPDIEALPGDLIPYITIGLAPAKDLDPEKLNEYLQKMQADRESTD